MNDILEFISELKELQALYHSGDLRNYDFETKIQQYEKIVEAVEKELEESYSSFYKVLDV
jgi:hypothetical protein